MTSQLHDVTAGTRAREIRERPETPQVIVDPTDPRFGEIFGAPGRASGANRSEDPTSPLYREAATHSPSAR